MPDRFLLLPEFRPAWRAAFLAAPGIGLIYGPARSGKSELLRTAAKQQATVAAADADPLAIGPVTAMGDWVEAYSIASQARRRVAFLQQSTTVSRLAFDDYDRVVLRGQVAIDFAEVIDRRGRNGLSTLFAGRVLPGHLDHGNGRLRDRLRSATVCELRPLSDSSVRKVLTHELSRQQIPTTAIACDALIPSLPRQIGPLYERIRQLLKTARRTDAELSYRLAVSSARSQRSASVATLAECTRLVAREFGVPTRTLQSRKRDAQSATARHVAMWLGRELADASWAAIGREFGGRSHSTVMHAHRRIEAEVSEGSDLGIISARLRHRLATPVEQ